MARARITSKGQITIPKEIRDEMGVGPGDSLEFFNVNGHFEVLPIKRRRIEEFRGLFRTEHTLPFAEERKLAWEARAREIMNKDQPDEE